MFKVFWDIGTFRITKIRITNNITANTVEKIDIAFFEKSYTNFKPIKMKILHLTLKKKWFDMIASGEKKEEYREIKPYWIKRMHFDIWNTKPFDYIEFKNGYGKNAPKIRLECNKIEIGKAKPEWSDNCKGDVFIIKLGEILNQDK